MKPEMILQADVLDIIFDNRNKEYGAYELRSHYERRLKKAMIIIFSSLAISVLVYCWLNNITHGKIIGAITSLTDTLTLTQVNIDREIPRPQIHQAQQHQVATIKNTKYLIVPDNAVTKPPPSFDQLDVNKISTETKTGDLPGDIVQPSSNGDGKNNLPETQPAVEKEEAIDHPDFMPEFPGGQEALTRFLSRNLKMPKDDLEAGTKVATLVRFIVDKEGTVTGIELEKSGGKDFDNEVMRVMKKMPVGNRAHRTAEMLPCISNCQLFFRCPMKIETFFCCRL